MDELLEESMFIHLHVHTVYSILDGANRIDDLIAKCKEYGMTALAITDHNHIGGWYDFYHACKDADIKPILGCEVYQTHDTNILSLSLDERKAWAEEKARQAGIQVPVLKSKATKAEKEAYNKIIEPYKYDTKQYHLILLAMNQTGYQNIIKLQSESSDRCTHNGRFCCDFDMLDKYNEGVICLSACLGGIIPSAISHKKYHEAEEYIQRFKEIYGDRFYLEIQPYRCEEQSFVNHKLIEYAQQYNIELVATNDTHYTNKEDWDDHDSLLCVGIGKTKNDESRMHYANEFWFKNTQEMLETFQYHQLDSNIIEKAIRNTKVIANRVSNNIVMGSKKPLFPKVYVPRGLTAEKYLYLKSFENLYKYKKENPGIDLRRYERRLKHELDTINIKGFAPYILKILENVDFCRENDIPIGPGRGSAAGSLCLFVNGATRVMDPIKYDLLFFRFLTKDRVDPPDVDMDYSYSRRPEIIEHLEHKHGQKAVAHIGTYTVLTVKTGVKDFSRVLGVPYNIANQMTSELDAIADYAAKYSFADLDKIKEQAEETIDIKLKKNLLDKYDRFVKMQNDYPEVFRLARKFEGIPRNMGVHASGVLVMPCNVTDYFPTRTEKGIRIALYTGPQLEALGAIKLDILGLQTLDVLDKCIKSVNPNAKIDDLYKEVSKHLRDPKIYKMLKNKESEGVFQLESDLFKGLLDAVQASDENDICALLALGRPGPLGAGMHKRYAERKLGNEEPLPQLRGTDNITQDTYNTIIYQEQCMLIAKQVAGFNDSQSDSIMRKALA